MFHALFPILKRKTNVANSCLYSCVMLLERTVSTRQSRMLLFFLFSVKILLGSVKTDFRRLDINDHPTGQEPYILFGKEEGKLKQQKLYEYK